MDQPSAFEVQYPLSPRKFWKKILGTVSAYFIIGVFCIACIIFIVSIGGNIGTTGDTTQFIQTITLAIGAFLLIYLVYVLLYAWYITAYIKRYYYDCGEQFVTIKKGVFAPSEIHVQYQKIQDVYVDQDILDRIMGLYDVHIASATVTSGIEAHIDGVDAAVAENLKNILLSKIHTSSNPSAPTQTSATQPLQTNPVQFSQKISSDTYPMSGAWIVSIMGNSIVYALALSLVLGLILSIGILYGALLFIFLFFVHLISQAIWKKNYYFEFTPEYILLRTGVFSRSENHLPYKSIQNVVNRQGILDRILGISTVTIQNAAQQMIQTRNGRSSVGIGISLVWQPKAKAEELNKILNDITSKINSQGGSSMGV